MELAARPLEASRQPQPAVAFRAAMPVLEERFRKKRRLGAGGICEVFLAEDTVTGEDVAIKALNKRYINSTGAIRVEAEALVRIKHPGVVSVKGISSDSTCIIVEFVPGKPLHALALSPRDIFDISLSMCDSVSAAHAAGVIHRDLKPENVMVIPETREVKVIDFGSAKVRGSSRPDIYEGKAVGTTEFMAPEAARGGEHADERSDVFSLGVTIYEMASKKLPFAGFATRVAARVMEMRKTLGSIPLRLRTPPFSQAFCDAVDRAIREDPRDRYQSVAEFREVLRQRMAIESAAPPLPPRQPLCSIAA